MITLNQLAQEVIRTLSGGDQPSDSRIERKEVVLRLRQAMNELLKLEILQNRNEGTRLPVAINIATYTGLEVIEEGNQYVTVLPDFYLSLPYNKGIYALYPDGRPKSQFVRRNNPYVSQVLPSRGLQGQEGYYVEGLKILYDNDSLGTKGKMTLKLQIAAPDSIELNDPLPIMPEQQSALVNKVTQDMTMQASVSDDSINNNDSPSIQEGQSNSGLSKLMKALDQ